MVSLNLAIFNLLPIPILDGGVILLLLVEMFMRRDLSLRVKEAVFKLGFVFLDGGGGVRALQRHLEAGGLNATRRSSRICCFGDQFLRGDEHAARCPPEYQ